MFILLAYFMCSSMHFSLHSGVFAPFFISNIFINVISLMNFRWCIGARCVKSSSLAFVCSECVEGKKKSDELSTEQLIKNALFRLMAVRLLLHFSSQTVLAGSAWSLLMCPELRSDPTVPLKTISGTAPVINIIKTHHYYYKVFTWS